MQNVWTVFHASQSGDWFVLMNCDTPQEAYDTMRRCSERYPDMRYTVEKCDADLSEAA